MSATIVREIFEVIDARNWDALHRHLTADVVLERPGYEPIRGIDMLLHFYQHARIISSGRYELWEVVASAQAAACWGRFRGASHDGRLLDERFADGYTLRGDASQPARRTSSGRPSEPAARAHPRPQGARQEARLGKQQCQCRQHEPGRFARLRHSGRRRGPRRPRAADVPPIEAESAARDPGAVAAAG
jgi:ketosteroid isomerase-like protein